jgi:hypothetical protein
MTISFNNIGSYGRLGNQMFQYAALRGIAHNMNYNWMIPPPDARTLDNYGLFDCFKMTNCNSENIGYHEAPSISMEDFHFNQKFFYDCPNNVDIIGYFQTEKYFLNIKNELLEDFSFKDDVYKYSQDFIDNIGTDKIVFLHVRRGDINLVGNRGEKWSYLMLPDHHPVCEPSYYIEALKHFPDHKVLIVSDVIDWCKQQDFLQGDQFIFSDASYQKFNDGASIPNIDLCLMTLCSDAIIANSSLSWWGAWLIKNENKKIIAPKKRYGSA